MRYRCPALDLYIFKFSFENASPTQPMEQSYMTLTRIDTFEQVINFFNRI